MTIINKIKTSVIFGAFIVISSAFASPPFISDSPEPTEYKHLELYFFGTLDQSSNGTSLQLPALEADWGFHPNCQLHVVVPVNMSVPQDGASTFGQGDVETSVAYRFLTETEHRPQVAISPTIEWPLGNSDQGLGNGRAWYKLPLWLQKSWSSWTAYGGGGYAFNSAPDMRDYPFLGLVVQHDFNDKLSLGSELFSQGANSINNKSYAVLNLGGYYNLNKHFSILMTVGHSVIGENHLLGYLGIHWVS